MAIKIVLNMAGFRELRTGAAAQDLLEEKARQLANRAGSFYEVRDYSITGGRGRGRIAVSTREADPRAMAHEAKNHTLAGLI